MKKRMFFLVGILFACITIVTIYGLINKGRINEKNKGKLDTKKIEELRNKYPLIGTTTSLSEYLEMNIEELTEKANTIIDAKVVEELPQYTTTINSSSGEKMDVKFYPYKMMVKNIISSDGTFTKKEGEYFTLVLSDINLADFPAMEIGMEGIFPIFKCEDKGREEYSIESLNFYYVVNDDYILSAYEESENDNYNGTVKKKLIEDIMNYKKLKK